eukprot:TRINITY_DN5319_c0_g1_i6.p1 TRINITY_DN5319_c0_g1~~TRINITY_DN5319_c0_g1_i6.p1  ORF type:complete len:164 (+),score=39.98 TRINITY_DN5319_c0_g1_i6:25-492(+)
MSAAGKKEQQPDTATAIGSDAAFAWGASLCPAKKVIEDGPETIPPDFWSWISGAFSSGAHSEPKSYGLREEELQGWSPAMGSIAEELSDCETELSTTASDGDLSNLRQFASSGSLKAFSSSALLTEHLLDRHCAATASSAALASTAKAGLATGES